MESSKGWGHQVYLPDGLEGEAPRNVEEVAMGLKLLRWYENEDFSKRAAMEREDARKLARWAFTLGVLKVVVSGTTRTMLVRETYQELLKHVEL